MKESIVAFYTDPRVRPTRFLLYACFVVIAFGYIAVNRLILSRPEHVVSLEVAALLVVMIATAPSFYDLILAYRERRNVVARLSSITRLLGQEGTTLDEVHRQLIELENLYLTKREKQSRSVEDTLVISKSYLRLINKLEGKRRRREAVIALAMVLIFGSSAVFLSGTTKPAIYLALASLLMGFLLYMLFRFEYRETVMKNLIEILILRAAFPHDLRQSDAEQKQRSRL